jgi:hypothetical protein
MVAERQVCVFRYQRLFFYPDLTLMTEASVSLPETMSRAVLMMVDGPVLKRYSVEKMWKEVAETKVDGIAVASFADVIDSDCWGKCTPRLVINNREFNFTWPRSYDTLLRERESKSTSKKLERPGGVSKEQIADHLRRIDRCDTSFPIIVDAEYNVYDGYHRIVKTMRDHRSERIEFKIITQEQLERCLISSVRQSFTSVLRRSPTAAASGVAATTTATFARGVMPPPAMVEATTSYQSGSRSTSPPLDSVKEGVEEFEAFDLEAGHGVLMRSDSCYASRPISCPGCKIWPSARKLLLVVVLITATIITSTTFISPALVGYAAM